MMSEKLFEKKLVKAVKKLGGEALKFWPVTFTGFPDRIVLLPGARIWFVELKSPGKYLSARQRLVTMWLMKLGFTVRVIDSEITLENFLNEIR